MIVLEDLLNPVSFQFRKNRIASNKKKVSIEPVREQFRDVGYETEILISNISKLGFTSKI